MESGLKWCIWDQSSVSTWFCFSLSAHACWYFYVDRLSLCTRTIIPGLDHWHLWAKQSSQCWKHPWEGSSWTSWGQGLKVSLCWGENIVHLLNRFGYVTTLLPQGVIMWLTALPGSTRNRKDVLRNQERVTNHMVGWNAEVVSLIQHGFLYSAKERQSITKSVKCYTMFLTLF